MSTYIKHEGTWKVAGGGMKYVEATTDYTAKRNERIGVKASTSVITITLPKTADIATGDIIEVIDVAGMSEAYEIQIYPDGNYIEGANQPFIINVNGYMARFLFDSGNYFLMDNAYRSANYAGESTGS